MVAPNVNTVDRIKWWFWHLLVAWAVLFVVAIWTGNSNIGATGGVVLGVWAVTAFIWAMTEAAK